MIRKATTYLLLIGMVLHCASRLELLDYLYKKQFDIAFAIGLTAEKAIAVCSSDYSYHSKLSLATEEHHPSGLVQAQEINLFAPAEAVLIPIPLPVELPPLQNGHFARALLSSLDEFFHPPTI